MILKLLEAQVLRLAATIPRPSDADIAAARGPLARAEADVEKANEKVRRANAAWDETGFLSDVHDYLTDMRRTGGRFKHMAAPEPRGDFHKVVEQARKEIDRIEMDVARVGNAPRTLAELRRAVELEIDRMARPPSVDLRVRETSPVKLKDAISGTRLDGGVVVGEPIGLVIWAMRDLFLDRALALLPDKEPEGAITDADREAAFDRLAAERLAMERQEEAAISAAAAAGLHIARRREADPRAILEIETIGGSRYEW